MNRLSKNSRQGWDMMIGFPDCTYLAGSGARWLYTKEYYELPKEDREKVKHLDKYKNLDRWGLMEKALDFFRLLMNAPIHRIALENPVGVISTKVKKPDQIIQPWQFGHTAQKTTCLWVKNLPLLVPTNVVDKGEFVTMGNGSKMPKWYSDCYKLSPKERAEKRSKTFKGIAEAMADQYTILDTDSRIINRLPKDIRILIACEESGAVRDAFLRLGYVNTYSCDLKPNPHPNHIQGDVRLILT